MIKKISRRSWLIGAIAMISIILLTIFAAPSNHKLNSGSTYNLGPDGYAGWYNFMREKGIKINRWEKPVEKLINQKDIPQPITLLRIAHNLDNNILDATENIDFQQQQKWLKQGNKIILLGDKHPSTQAPFSSTHNTPSGQVKIDTSRRAKIAEEQGILLDKFGAIVWKQAIDQGTIIYANTPHLAANAYQDFSANYEFLANLVTQNSKSFFVDEYMHGYRDKETIKETHPEGIISYLSKTPILPIFAQMIVILIIVIWAANRRFGQPINLSAPVVENTQAYISALAGVLQKADSTDFVVDLVGKAKQLELQKTLGLGNILLDRNTLINAWVEQTGNSPQELAEILKPSLSPKRLTENQLKQWLEKWNTITNQQLK